MKCSTNRNGNHPKGKLDHELWGYCMSSCSSSGNDLEWLCIASCGSFGSQSLDQSRLSMHQAFTWRGFHVQDLDSCYVSVHMDMILAPGSRQRTNTEPQNPSIITQNIQLQEGGKVSCMICCNILVSLIPKTGRTAL